MKITRMFPGKVQGGKIQVADARGWERLVQSLEGKNIEVGVAERRKARTLSQNSYFHSVIVPILAEAAGDDDMKATLKKRFLRDGATGRIRGTSTLSTAEFSEFIDRCVRLGAEFYGVTIPDPFFLGEQ